MQDNKESQTEENFVDEKVADAPETSTDETPLNTDDGTEVNLENAPAAAAVEVDPWEQLELEAAKWKDQATRTAAELSNYRKRMSREKLDAVRYGNKGLLEELLPVLDNFDMGMQAAAQEKGSMLFMGMDMVHKQIGEFLSNQGVSAIDAEAGGEFNPTLHEALSQEHSEDVPAEKILRVMRKGYKMGERLLRPANVTISLGVVTEKEEETKTESE